MVPLSLRHSWSLVKVDNIFCTSGVKVNCTETVGKSNGKKIPILA